MAQAKDYYNTLGVSKDATKEDIKQAYKKLAKKYHPDLNKEAGSTEKFKEINEAAAVLSDDKKRANYDRFGTSDEAFGPGGFDYKDFEQGFGRDFDVDDIFEQFFGGGMFGSGRKRQRKSGAERGADLRFEMEITLEEAAFGVEKEITIPKLETCTSCQGLGAESENDIVRCQTCGGSGVQTIQQRTPFGVFQSNTTCRACGGVGRQIKKPCKKCHGDGRTDVRKTIHVKIPGGVDTGMRVRVSNEGEAGLRGGDTGDLYIVVHVLPHKIFERKDDDIHITLPVSFTQAALGDDIEVPTLDGRETVRIQPGTQSGTIFRLREHGVKHVNGRGKGDQMIHVQVEVPTRLSSRQKEILMELGEISGKPQKGIFDKLKRMF